MCYQGNVIYNEKETVLIRKIINQKLQAWFCTKSIFFSYFTSCYKISIHFCNSNIELICWFRFNIKLLKICFSTKIDIMGILFFNITFTLVKFKNFVLTECFSTKNTFYIRWFFNLLKKLVLPRFCAQPQIFDFWQTCNFELKTLCHLESNCDVRLSLFKRQSSVFTFTPHNPTSIPIIQTKNDINKIYFLTFKISLPISTFRRH